MFVKGQAEIFGFAGKSLLVTAGSEESGCGGGSLWPKVHPSFSSTESYIRPLPPENVKERPISTHNTTRRLTLCSLSLSFSLFFFYLFANGCSRCRQPTDTNKCKIWLSYLEQKNKNKKYVPMRKATHCYFFFIFLKKINNKKLWCKLVYILMMARLS